MRFRSLLLLWLITLCLTRIAMAQVTTFTDDISTPLPGGHDYIRLLSETVNPANGSVSMRIQLPTAKSRGLTLPFSINYDSDSVHHLVPGYYPNFGTVNWKANTGTFSQGGWSYGVPLVGSLDYSVTEGNYPNFYTCAVNSPYTFRDPSGTSHQLGLGFSQSANGPCQETPIRSGGDGPYQATLSSLSSVLISSPDGTLFNFGNVPESADGSAQSLPTYIEDRNGNKIVSTSNGFKDTADRTLISWSGFGPSGSTNTVTLAGLSYIITWKTVTANFTVPSSWSGVTSGPNSTFGFCSPIPQANDSQVVISQLTLPNGQSYKFYYGTDNPNAGFQNPYGMLSEIDYPTGASVRYTWKLSDYFNELADYPGEINQPGTSCSTDPQAFCPAPVPDYCLYQYQTPVVATRQVYFGGSSSPALTQTFTYSTAWAATQSGYDGPITWNSKFTNVTSTDNLRSKNCLTAYSYSSMAGPPAPPYSHTSFPTQIPVEHTISYYDWGNTTTPLRVVTKSWASLYTLASEQITLLDINQSSKTTFQYGPGLVVTEKDEYDFGQTSPPTRKTKINYQAFAATPIYPSAVSILDKPCQSITYDANSNRVAETDYFYDGSASTTPCVTAATQTLPGTGTYTEHDEANYGTSASVPRGNATKVVGQCFASSTTCASGNSTNTFAYDETGQITSKTDACGNASCSDMTGSSHTTTYSYADNYDSYSGTNTNAYLTRVTDSLGHISKFKYAYSDGQLIQSQDQNDINASRVGTTYSYGDFLRRLTETDYPDTGKTTISYSDAPPSPSVTTSRLMSGSQYITGVATLDGIGHIVKTLLTNDPDCASSDRTDTTYDGLGHVYTASNPYCTTGDQTYGLTTYTYDALGRTTQVAHPDGNTILTTYTGRATQVQDEGNGNGSQRVTRISQVDGFGHLISVCEVSSATLIGQNAAPAACGQDIAATGFLTTYQYNALDDLTQVSQGTMAARTFGYDSLSRLTNAFNPESGTITFSYDVNGNLASKTAPLPNQTGSSTVTTTYQYDALNRNTQKSYSDGTTVANFLYDAANVDGFGPFTNPVGRLVRATAACAKDYRGYDTMGRVTTNLQVSPVTCATNYPDFVLSYGYDLLGNMTSYTNGEFDTFSNTFNGAGRLTSLTSSYSSPPNFPPNLLSAVHYNAAGEIISDTLGDGETEIFAFDKRLRPLSATSSYSGATTYSYSLTYAPNGDILAANDSVNGNWTYSYDPFNRLVGSNKNSGSAVYSYVYDRFGNRWQQNGPYSFQATFTGNNPGNPQNNNRIDGSSYDAAGNLLNDGIHAYAYDAENRITSVDAGATATYVYDAYGRRVVKTTASKIFNVCSGSTGGSVYYLYDLAGHAGVYTASGTNQCHDEIYAGGRHLATYEGGATFVHADWLGTERSRISSAYVNNRSYDQLYTSNPFGDGLTGGNSNYASPLHFTGKERDSESGLDNFGARYNSSAMGRFMSPDAVRYSRLTDPQTWNLYSYVGNNPLNKIDLDGHDWFYVDQKWQWQKGHIFHDKDGNATKDKGYRYLLEFKKTGTNKEGAAVGTLTLHDQNTVAAQSQAFSGGHGFTIIPNGNFTIRLDIRGQATDASSMKANQEELRQFYGIQQISTVVTDSNGQPAGGSGDFRWEWGSIRAGLNEPAGETRPEFQGNYLHGKNRPGDYTHGCICERSENILHFLLQNINPTEDPKVPVSVQ